MNTRFGVLGTVLAAVFVLNAVLATAAVAEGEYTASSYPTTVTGASPLGNTTFNTEAGSMECFTHYEASLSETSFQLTAKATITECRAFGFLSGSVTMGSCDHLITTPVKSGADLWKAATHLKCTNPAQPIRVTASTCEATIGEQSPGGHITITNNTGGGDVTIQANVSGINYTVTKDGFGCPFSGTGAKTGATYIHHEPVTLKATNGGSIHIG
jgi:hypothetical protein